STRTCRLRSIDAIEIGFITLFELSTTFERQATTGHGRCDCNWFRTSIFPALTTLSRRSAAHLCALLFQDSLAATANAIAFDVDLHARLLDDGANHFAAGPNHVADFIDRNLQSVDSWGKAGNFLAMSRDDFIHLAENEHAATLRLGESLAHNLRGDAADFNV